MAKFTTPKKEKPAKVEEKKLQNGNSKENEPKSKSNLSNEDSKPLQKAISKGSASNGWDNSSGSSSSDESDEEKKSKPIQKSSPPPTKPSQIVEVKHEDSDDEKSSTAVEKIRKASTSSSSGSSDSSSSSDDSESEHSDSISSPVAKTSAKDLTTSNEKHTPERVISSPTKTAGEKKEETAGLKTGQPHSTQTASEVKPAPEKAISSPARTAPEKDIETWGFNKFQPLTVKPIGEVNQKDEIKPANEGTSGSTYAKDRKNSASSISSFSSLGSSSSTTSSGSSSSSSTGSSSGSKKEGSANGGKKIDDQHSAKPAVEETKVEFVIESKDKVVSRETQDGHVMPEKDLKVDVTLTSEPKNEEKDDQQKNRRSSDASVSSLASSASSTSSSSSSSSPSEGSLVLKNEVDSKATGGEAADPIIPLLPEVPRNSLETQEEVNESLSESETEKESESKALPEKEEVRVPLVVPPRAAPITMAKPVEEYINTMDKNDSESGSSSDRESDSSSSNSSVRSGGSHKGSRRSSNASKKSNDENNKQELSHNPVIKTENTEEQRIEHAEQKIEHAEQKIEHAEQKIEHAKEQKIEHKEIKNPHAEKQTTEVAGETVVTQLRSNHPEPRDGSILYELEKGNQIVDIKNIKLNKSQIQEVSEFLENKKNMSQLSVVNCDLKDEDIRVLKDAIIASPSKLVVLNLAENQLTAGCISHLLQLFKNKPSIEAVILSGCNIGNEGVKKMADGLLEEYKNSFQAESKDAQSDEDGNKELRELDLSNCNIGDEGIEALCSLIRSGMAIDTLNLSANRAITQKGWVTFARSLTKAKVLETLVLDSNPIGNEGLEELTRSLYENESLAALDLNDIGINDKGGKCLIELLKRNTIILEINLHGNELSEQLVDDINKYISLNKSVHNE